MFVHHKQNVKLNKYKIKKIKKEVYNIPLEMFYNVHKQEQEQWLSLRIDEFQVTGEKNMEDYLFFPTMKISSQQSTE